MTCLHYIYLFCNFEMTIDIFPWLLPKRVWWYDGNFFPTPLNKKIKRAKKIRKQIYFDDVSFDDWQRYKCTTQHQMSTQILMNLSASFSACFYFLLPLPKRRLLYTTPYSSNLKLIRYPAWEWAMEWWDRDWDWRLNG